MSGEIVKSAAQKLDAFFTTDKITTIQAVCDSDINSAIIDVKQQIVKNDKLQKCTPLSIIGAIITASRFGVSLDVNKKLAYLIPYGNECKLELSYMAFIEIMNNIL